MRSPTTILSELEVFGIRLGLESTRTLLHALGDPQSRYPVVLVGGTNGKGSTSSLLASILDAAGLRVGLYTSPHLEDVEERIRVEGRSIETAALASELERAVAIGRETLGHPPTYFEAVTVAAYHWFAAARVDIAVMEVGLGGRLDATNAAEPVLSIVTSISRDHVKVLGDTLDRIAREKAGIFRPGRTALHGVRLAEARAALEDAARRLGTRLLDADALGAVEEDLPDAAGRRIRLRTITAEHSLELGMRGAYQARNVLLAVLGAELLEAEQKLSIGRLAVERGARGWRWPGRCEIVVLPGGREVLLDAAHNEDGISSLKRELDAGWPGGEPRRGESWQGRSPGRGVGPAKSLPWRLVFGALDDKPAAAMLREIAAQADRVILLRPPSPRGVSPLELARSLPERDCLIAEDAAAALDLALAGGDARIVVCGSIYLVGDARRELRRRFGVPPPAVAPWNEGRPGSEPASPAAGDAPRPSASRTTF
jgi:dihydrofolate synthase / folylpolyglutamate synthase